MSSIGAIILAAGASTRMGSPKQLLEHSGEPLLRQAARRAVEAGADPVVVVLGHAAEACLKCIEDLPLLPVFNDGWREGLASSLRSGIATLRARNQACEAAMVLLADQVEVTTPVLQGLIRVFRSSGKGIAASQYGEVLGPPAVFHARYFSSLAALTGDRGARSLIAAAKDDVAPFEFAGGATDLDTPEDLERWRQAKQGRPSARGGGT